MRSSLRTHVMICDMVRYAAHICPAVLGLEHVTARYHKLRGPCLAEKLRGQKRDLAQPLLIHELWVKLIYCNITPHYIPGRERCVWQSLIEAAISLTLLCVRLPIRGGGEGEPGGRYKRYLTYLLLLVRATYTVV
jgi:hypothetical protein